MIKIKELRTESGITQKQLAGAIGVKNYTVANWEQGRTAPAVEDLCALADYFECSIDYLTGRTDETGNVVLLKDLAEDETKILKYYRNLSTDRKVITLAVLQDMATAANKQ